MGSMGFMLSTRQGMPEALLEDGRCKEGFFPRAFRGPVDLGSWTPCIQNRENTFSLSDPVCGHLSAAALEANTGVWLLS